MNLKEEVEQLLLDQGALRVGFANAETLAGGPTCTDITYKLPEAKTAIIFAMPFNKKIIRAFLAKELPNGRSDYEKDQFDLHIKVYNMSKEVAHFLEKKGYKAAAFFPNNKYREDIPGWRMKLMPELSLRYAAVKPPADRKRSRIDSLGDGHSYATLPVLPLIWKLCIIGPTPSGIIPLQRLIAFFRGRRRVRIRGTG